MSRHAALAEQWRPVFGYEGLYLVSDQGRVYSVARLDSRGVRRGGKYLLPHRGGPGYLLVDLWRSNTRRSYTVHLLVCEAFYGPRPEGNDVRHMDGNPLNNRAANLQWGTSLENASDRQRHGTQHRGSRTGGAVLTEDRVRAARQRYAAGETQAAIAREYGVSPAALCEAISGKKWRHVA